MEERNKSNEQSNNEQHIKVLQRLLSIVDEQGRSEYAEPLKAAIQALEEQPEKSDEQGNGLKLSGSPSDQLLQMAAAVRSTSLSPSQRTAAAHQLVRLSGGR